MQYPNFSLDGQVAIITGASRGIGYGLSKAFANAGAKVAVCARDLDSLERLVGEIESEGHQAKAYRLDVTDVQTIQPTFKQISDDFNGLDILVNNAGMGDNAPALEVTEAGWDQMFAVNTKGLFFAAQAAARHMLERGYGRIVNMSSQASVVGIKNHATYCATKGAVNQLTRVLALEWSASGVTVNAIGPTFIYTPGTAERLDDPDFLKSVVDRIPAGKVGSITDVAAAAIFLASPAASLVTGEHLLVDGGWTAQ